MFHALRNLGGKPLKISITTVIHKLSSFVLYTFSASNLPFYHHLHPTFHQTPTPTLLYQTPAIPFHFTLLFNSSAPPSRFIFQPNPSTLNSRSICQLFTLPHTTHSLSQSTHLIHLPTRSTHPICSPF